MKDSEETRGTMDISRDGLRALLGISDVFSKDTGPKVFRLRLSIQMDNGETIYVNRILTISAATTLESQTTASAATGSGSQTTSSAVIGSEQLRLSQ